MTRRASSRRSSKRRRSTRRSSKHRSSRGLRANEKSESRKAAEFRIMMSLHRDDPDYSKQIAQMRSGGDLEAVGLLEDLAAKNAVHRANYALFDKTVEPYIGHGLAFNRTNEDGVQVITVRLNEATTRPIVTLRVSASGRVTSVAVDKELLRYARSGGSVEDKLAVVERILADHAQPNSRSSKRLRANAAHTVTVTKKGKRFVITHSRLPGQKFGPFDFAEAGRDLFIGALLSRMDARNLVLDASEHCSATAECGG